VRHCLSLHAPLSHCQIVRFRLDHFGDRLFRFRVSTARDDSNLSAYYWSIILQTRNTILLKSINTKKGSSGLKIKKNNSMKPFMQPLKLVVFRSCHCRAAFSAASFGRPLMNRGVLKRKYSCSPSFIMKRALHWSTRRVKFFFCESNPTVWYRPSDTVS
jgi:hypothetical protein